jgi:hypothetical protein
MSRQRPTDAGEAARRETGRWEAVDRRTREQVGEFTDTQLVGAAADRPIREPTPEERQVRAARVFQESRGFTNAPTVERTVALENFTIDRSPVAYLRQREGRALDSETTQRVRWSLEAHGIRSADDLRARGVDDAWHLYPELSSTRDGLPQCDGCERSPAIAREVHGTLDRLPREHVADLDRVLYTDAFTRDEKGILLGKYDRVTRRIEINRHSASGVADAGEVPFTVAHEVGHHVYWHHMTEEQREEWDGISRASQTSEYVTDYARSNPRDDFAESYAFHALQPEVLSDASAAKAAFLEEQWTSG